MAEISNVDRYKEQYAHFRSMNDILYKIPPIFTAIIGGLWFFAASNLDKFKLVACAVFIFCAIASVCFVNVMQRFRLAFNGYIDNLNKMDGEMKVTARSSKLPSTIATIQYLLWAAAVVSVCGAIYAGVRRPDSACPIKTSADQGASLSMLMRASAAPEGNLLAVRQAVPAVTD